MASSWDGYAEDWDHNEDVILYAELAFKSLLNEANPQDLHVLDFGSGTGLLTEKIAQYASKVVAIDTSEKMLAVLNQKDIHNIETLAIDLCQTDVKTVPALNRKFDLITASSVFSFVDDYEAVLSKLKTLLAPNGTLIQWDWLSANGEHGLSKEQIEHAYNKTGFTVSKISTPFSIESQNSTVKVIMTKAKQA